MKKYLAEFFEMFSYPEEAAAALNGAYEELTADQSRQQQFEALMHCYAADKNCDFKDIFEKIRELSDAAGIHRYTGELLLFICLSKALKQHYLAEGVDEEIWFTSMCDLKYKLVECQLVHGIWGSFVAPWFVGFFNMTRFGFGKLQFELEPFRHHYEKGGIVLKPDDLVINTHIPRTGSKLDREAKAEAYRKAGEFFRKRLGNQPIAFVCHSWLLFPRNLEILSPESNLYAFISDFDIIEWQEYGDYREVWRLFDVEYNGDVEQLPQNTSFRRAYANWIRNGEKTGWGYGVFLL